jgi:hypothetical protein
VINLRHGVAETTWAVETGAHPADNVTTYIEAGRNELDRRPDLISNRVLLNPLSKPERM